MNWLQYQFELSRSDDHGNVRPMEGLRGFAVFLVFLVHYVTLIDPWIGKQAGMHLFAESLHAIGNVGVDLFFVLSGYLIYGSLVSRRQAFLPFMARRVKRLYPAFMVVFAAYVMLSFVFPKESKIPESAWPAALYLLQNFLLLPGLLSIEPMITVAWSLSYEMFYYLATPVLVAGLGLRSRSAGWRISFFIALAAGTAVYCALYGGPVRLIMFISGILLHETLRHDLIRPPGSGIAFFALVAGLLSALLDIGGSLGSAIQAGCLFAAFFIVCLTCFARPDAKITQTFTWTPLRWLGNMSYSYYLIHGLALKAAFLMLMIMLPSRHEGILFFFCLLPLMFILTLVPSAILFIAIERPFSLVQKPVQVRISLYGYD